MGFTFKERTRLSICGREYEIDLLDVGFIETIVTDFLGLQQQYTAFEGLQQQLLSKGEDVTEQELTALAAALTEQYGQLLALAQGFIAHALGQVAYDEIFAGRRPNGADHLDLCAYIYQSALAGRGEVVERYVQPRAAVHPAAKQPRSRRKSG